MLDLSSNYCAHLRITGDKTQCKTVIDAYFKKFKAVSAVCGYEEKGENHHMHCHIELDATTFEYHTSDKGKTARSAFFKKHHLTGLYNFDKLKKTPLNNILYVIKDLDIVAVRNVEDEQLEELRQMTSEINENKRLDQRHKLYEKFKEHIHNHELLKMDTIGMTEYQLEEHRNIHRISYILKFIHKVYILEWDRDVPLGQLKAYVLYIAEHISREKNPMISYDAQIHNFYENFMNVL
jgi:hypothetical protein